MKTKESPCTERYARWCERSASQLMISLLLDCESGAQALCRLGCALSDQRAMLVHRTPTMPELHLRCRPPRTHFARIASAMPPAVHSLCQNCVCDAARRALTMPELRLRCGARRHHQSPCASGRTVVFGRPDFSEAKSAFPLHPRRRFRCRGCLLPMESGLRRQRL